MASRYYLRKLREIVRQERRKESQPNDENIILKAAQYMTEALPWQLRLQQLERQLRDRT